MINRRLMLRVLMLLFVVGAGVRAIDLWRPVDGTVREAWRESDTAGIARNYYREGMNLFYPRIDWRGDGPGYVEMEFPIFPWSIAAAYKVFGYHEVIGRIISYVLSLLTIAVFFRLATYLLPPIGALTASGFFVLSPLVVRISNAMQPEALMFFCYVAATYAFLKWLDEDSWKYFALALAATALAILAKATAAHLGFVFIGLLLWKRGFVALRDKRVWMFAVAALLPGALWYFRARGFWVTYGNSLGMSNEAHVIGWDFFTNRGHLLGLTVSELFHVWMPTGLIVGAFALATRFSTDAVRVALLWLVGIALYYLIFIRTTSASWAVYYHVVAVPPAALLIGATAAALTERMRSRIMWMVLGSGTIVWLLTVGLIAQKNIPLGFASPSLLKAVAVMAALSFGGLLALEKHAHSRIVGTGAQTRTRTSPAAALALFALPGTFLLQARQIAVDAHPSTMQNAYACAQQLAPVIPEDALIVATGGECTFGPRNLPAAYNASFMLY